eukprot:scaffold223683_cov18-Tisochrysis_lutea.AAC.2
MSLLNRPSVIQLQANTEWSARPHLAPIVNVKDGVGLSCNLHLCGKAESRARRKRIAFVGAYYAHIYWVRKMQHMVCAPFNITMNISPSHLGVIYSARTHLAHKDVEKGACLLGQGCLKSPHHRIQGGGLDASVCWLALHAM